MEEQLSLEFLRVVENGAIAAARTMGFGDRHKADEVAVEAMRKTMDAVQMDGTIVIGEGERDEDGHAEEHVQLEDRTDIGDQCRHAGL